MVLENYDNWCEKQAKRWMVWKVVWVTKMYISKALKIKGLSQSHGLQNPNNEINQSLVVLDFKPIARLFLYYLFHSISRLFTILNGVYGVDVGVGKMVRKSWTSWQ